MKAVYGVPVNDLFTGALRTPSSVYGLAVGNNCSRELEMYWDPSKG